MCEPPFSRKGQWATACSQSFQPAVPARTASPRMRSWYDGLGSGCGRLLGPPELGPIGPDASQDHGDLAGYGDTRLLRSEPPRQPRSPCLEGRPALHFREKDAGSLIKTGAGKSVPAFRYPALPIRFSGLIPSRRQSEIGTDIPSPLEPVRLIDRGAECKGCYRPDARHRHETSQRHVVADKTTDLLVQSRHLGNGNLPHFDQFVDERQQDRMVLGEHPCALGESTFVAALRPDQRSSGYRGSDHRSRRAYRRADGERP